MAKIQITFNEERDIITRIDQIASAEGLNRADIIRRAIRIMLISLPNSSIEAILPLHQIANNTTAQ